MVLRRRVAALAQAPPPGDLPFHAAWLAEQRRRHRKGRRWRRRRERWERLVVVVVAEGARRDSWQAQEVEVEAVRGVVVVRRLLWVAVAVLRAAQVARVAVEVRRLRWVEAAVRRRLPPVAAVVALPLPQLVAAAVAAAGRRMGCPRMAAGTVAWEAAVAAMAWEARQTDLRRRDAV